MKLTLKNTYLCESIDVIKKHYNVEYDLGGRIIFENKSISNKKPKIYEEQIKKLFCELNNDLDLFNENLNINIKIFDCNLSGVAVLKYKINENKVIFEQIKTNLNEDFVGAAKKLIIKDSLKENNNFINLYETNKEINYVQINGAGFYYLKQKHNFMPDDLPRFEDIFEIKHNLKHDSKNNINLLKLEFKLKNLNQPISPYTIDSEKGIKNLLYIIENKKQNKFLKLRK